MDGVGNDWWVVTFTLRLAGWTAATPASVPLTPPLRVAGQDVALPARVACPRPERVERQDVILAIGDRGEMIATLGWFDAAASTHTVTQTTPLLALTVEVRQTLLEALAFLRQDRFPRTLGVVDVRTASGGNGFQ